MNRFVTKAVERYLVPGLYKSVKESFERVLSEYNGKEVFPPSWFYMADKPLRVLLFMLSITTY